MKKDEFTVGEIDEAAERLRAVPPVDPAKLRISTREAIGRLKGEIVRLKDGGYSMEEIVGFLVGEGIAISPSALKEHLRAPKKRRKNGSRKKSAGVAAAPPPLPVTRTKPTAASAPSAKPQQTNGSAGA